MDTTPECKRIQDDINVLWENRELDLNAIEADAEKDIKPDINELDKMIAMRSLGTNYCSENKMNKVRSSLSAGADSYMAMEDNLRSSEEQCDIIINEYLLSCRQFEESLISDKISIQKMEDKALSVKLECDDKLRDMYFQKERYACDLSIEQLKCDLSKEFSRKQALLISNVKKQISQHQKDIQKEYNLQSELETQSELLEKDIKILEDNNESLHNSLIELEQNVEMVTRVSLELKQNIARKDNELNVLNQEYQLLHGTNDKVSTEVQMLCPKDEKTIQVASALLPETEVSMAEDKIDTEIRHKESELKNLLSDLNIAETTLADYNSQAKNWILNKKKLLEIRSILASKDLSNPLTECKVKNEIKAKNENQELDYPKIITNIKDKTDKIQTVEID